MALCPCTSVLYKGDCDEKEYGVWFSLLVALCIQQREMKRTRLKLPSVLSFYCKAFLCLAVIGFLLMGSSWFCR